MLHEEEADCIVLKEATQCNAMSHKMQESDNAKKMRLCGDLPSQPMLSRENN